MLLKSVPHVQHDYFSSFNQSDHCFLVLSLPLPSSLLKLPITRKQIRAYTPRGYVGLRFSFKPENGFFHLNNASIASKCSDPVNEESLIITEHEKVKLKISHRNMLRKEFGVKL